MTGDRGDQAAARQVAVRRRRRRARRAGGRAAVPSGRCPRCGARPRCTRRPGRRPRPAARARGPGPGPAVPSLIRSSARLASPCAVLTVWSRKPARSWAAVTSPSGTATAARSTVISARTVATIRPVIRRRRAGTRGRRWSRSAPARRASGAARRYGHPGPWSARTSSSPRPPPGSPGGSGPGPGPPPARPGCRIPSASARPPGPATATLRVRRSTVSGPCRTTSPPGWVRRSTARIRACSSLSPNGLTR